MSDPGRAQASRLLTVVLTLAAVALAVLLLWGALQLLQRLRTVLIMVLISVVLSYLLNPIVDFLAQFKIRGNTVVSRLSGTIVAFALLIAVLTLASQFAGKPVARDAEALQNQLVRYEREAPKLVRRYSRWYRERIPPPVQDEVRRQWDNLRQQAAEENWARSLVGITAGSVGFVVELFLVPILVFYFLSDLPKVKEAFLFFVPPRYATRAERGLTEAAQVFGKFLVGQVILCFIAFVVVAAGLRALRMEFWLSLGVLAGLTRAIPIIGPIVAGIVIVVVALFSKGAAAALWLLVAFALLHFLESKLLMPALLGFQVGVHPVLIIVGLLVGQEFFGIIGMFLAVPALGVTQRLIQQYREAKPAVSPEAAA